MKNSCKKIFVALFTVLFMTTIAHAYETSNYTIDIPDNLTKMDMEEGVVFVNEDEDFFVGIIELDGKDLTDDDFYTDEVKDAMKQTADEYFDRDMIPSFENDETGNPTGIKYMGPTGENALIQDFTKNKYKSIDISRGIILRDTNIADDESADKIYGLRYIYTLQNGTLYGVVGFYENLEDFNAIVDTLTFKTPEEPKAEDPTKAPGKLPQMGINNSIESLIIVLMVSCGSLLVVNNLKKED